jgi:hypothetical protein
MGGIGANRDEGKKGGRWMWRDRAILALGVGLFLVLLIVGFAILQEIGQMPGSPDDRDPRWPSGQAAGP